MTNHAPMRFAIIGCGYVADYYLSTVPNHPNLELAGVFDHDAERCRRFSSFFGLASYRSLSEVLEDPTIQLVANLTNPRSHFGVSKACLEAGKHVYSEKPLAASFREAQQLVELAEQRGLLLACAPSNLLSETAQTVWKALRDGRIGTPRLAYAELCDPILFQNYREWKTASGAPWPFEDEFETGCTIEHAGYYMSWLTAFFGPAKRIVSFAGTLVRQKGGRRDHLAPDLSVGCVEFASGPVARITCSIYPTRDHTLRIFGDDGVLTVPDCWDYGAPVYLDMRTATSWRERHPRRARLLGMDRLAVPLVRPAAFRSYRDCTHRMDFARGIADLADAALNNRQSRLPARWSLHVTELVLAMSEGVDTREMRTTFEPPDPMPWAS